MRPTALPKVLCVDDEDGLLRSLRWLLRGRYEVAVASSGLDGLALLGAEHFDVVISDQRMPGMSGTEFLERARDVSPRSVRLLLTGQSDINELPGPINDSGVFSFIPKPWDNQKLLDTVSDAANAARTTRTSQVNGGQATSAGGFDGVEEHVLVFDSDADVGAQWEVCAHGAGNTVYTNDMGEAVNHLAAQNVAVLITDVQGMSSRQMDLIRAVRRNLPRVVVLVYSQERDSSMVGQLINKGVIHRFIAKPATPEQLKRTLHSALARHRELSVVPERALRRCMQRAEDLGFERALDWEPDSRPDAGSKVFASKQSWWQRLVS